MPAFFKTIQPRSVEPFPHTMEFIYTTSYHHLGLRMANNMENIINMMNKGYDDLSKLQAEALVGSSGTYNFTWHSSLLGPTICFTIITYLYLNPDSTFSGLMLMKWRTRWRRSQRPMLLSTTFCSVQGWDSDMQYGYALKWGVLFAPQNVIL